jgi:DNA-binding PadR family transcriptional regulator
MILSLILFSGSMEMRGRKLYEVMPMAHETLREFREVRNVLSDDEDLEFLVQLQRNLWSD